MRPTPEGLIRGRRGGGNESPPTPPRDERDNVLPFRRRRDVRRLRRSPWRKFLSPFSAAFALVAVPTAIVTWIMMSPSFALAEMTVDSGERVSEAWVRASLRPLVGENLPLLSLVRAETMLRRHPWVESADLRKELPTRLSVRITEKRAVALWRDGHELRYLDPQGAPIEAFDPLAGSTNLLLISRVPQVAPSGLGSAVRMANEIEAVGPSWLAGLSEIEMLGEEDFRIFTSSLPFPLLVRAGTLEQKARRLEALLPYIVERYDAAAAVDLRFARRIIVQPSVFELEQI